jgi:hypothetical protein
MAEHLSALGEIVQTDQEVTHEYTVLNGYAAVLKGVALKHVLGAKDVDYVEQDRIVSIQSE